MAPTDGITRKAIGARLELLRVALKIESKAEFSRRLGISPQAYGNYAEGTNRPNLEMAFKIVRATGTTLDFIYRGELGGLPLQLADAIRAAIAEGDEAKA